MVLCDLATSSTCSFRTLSISCSAIAFTRASCQTDHANVEVVRTSAGLHLRQTESKKGSRRQAPALVIMVWAADMSLFHKSLATSQIRDISSSFRTADGTLSHSHLALTLLRGRASSVMSADYRKHTWQRKKGAAGQGDEKGEAQAHRAERTACHRRGC